MTAIQTGKSASPSPELAEKVRGAPVEPGCYVFKNASGHVIYVGKGKNIRHRVRQYFQQSHQRDIRDKVWKLVRAVADVEFVVTPSELDALLEEYRLIKLHRPWFNAQLKRDVVHPYLCIRPAGPYATLSVAEEKQEDGAGYYGGFFNEDDVTAAIDALHRAWRTPCCGKAQYPAGGRACLQYHLGACLAPCEGKVSPHRYAGVMGEIAAFLEGGGSEIFPRLRAQMERHAAALEFERAAACKSLLADLERLQRKCGGRYEFPPDGDILLFIRPYRSEGLTVFYLHRGRATARLHFDPAASGAELAPLLAQVRARKVISGDGMLEKGLAEIYAEKRFVPVANAATEEEIAALVKTGLGYFNND